MPVETLDYVFRFDPAPAPPPVPPADPVTYELQNFISVWDIISPAPLMGHTTTWDSADGVDTPLGCLKMLNTSTDRFFLGFIWAGHYCIQDPMMTWEDMGVPAGSTVTHIRYHRLSYRTGGTFAHLGVALTGADNGPPYFQFGETVYIPNSLPGQVGLENCLVDAFAIDDGGVAWQTHNVGDSIYTPLTQEIKPAWQPSNSEFRASLAYVFPRSAATGHHIKFDNVTLRITYIPPEARASAWPLEDHWGRYHRAHSTEALDLFYRRADFAAPPPFVLQTLPSGGYKRDSEPRMVYDDRDRLRLVFARKFIVNTPASLTAAPLSSTRVRLTWVDTSTLSPKFRLFAQPAVPGGFGGYEIIDDDIPAGSTSYDATGLTPGTLYRFHLDAIVTSPTPGTSDDAGPVDATTPGP